MRAIAAIALLFLAAPLGAQETRDFPEDAASPTARLTEMGFAIGRWHGPGIEGHPAVENWLPATGGTMVGTFIQADEAGEVMFTEHMYLMEEAGSLVLRLKHFNPDLTGWEEKDGMASFPLRAIAPCRADFRALTMRCDGPDGLVVAVRMSNADGSAGELVFRFARAENPPVPSRCPDAATTLDMDQCHADILAEADARRAEYLAAALERFAAQPDLARMIAASDEAFAAYREAECDAVVQRWIEGTIRGVMTLGCRIEMTDRRTHTIWQNWLTYPDSTPPILPEPGPTG